MYWASLVILLAPIAVILRRLPRTADEARTAGPVNGPRRLLVGALVVLLVVLTTGHT